MNQVMNRMMGLMLAVIMLVLSAQGQRKDFSGMKFCIDPGHGGHSSNDRPPVFSGLPFWESDGNFAKALHLETLLKSRGATVILTRYTNDYPNDADEPSLSARYTIANQNNVNWFHSIHSNATGGTNTGTNYTLILLKENTYRFRLTTARRRRTGCARIIHSTAARTADLISVC